MKKIAVILTLLLFVLAVGCRRDGGPGGAEESPFIGGTIGVLLDFMDGAPPEEVYDGGTFPFDISVKLKNDGETEVNAADYFIRITGIDPVDFGVTNLTQRGTEDLLATKKDPEGNIIQSPPVYITFEGLNYLSNLSGNTPFPIRAELCYLYQTIANAKLCVRKDVLQPYKEGVCIVNEKKTVFNSGAPVQVIEFEETARGKDKITLTFKIGHKGNGDIYEQNTRCQQVLPKQDKIFVTVETGIDGDLSCSGLVEGTGPANGYIRLYNGERTVTCTQTLNDPGDYEKIAKITLDYKYLEDKQTQILVKHG